MLVGRDRRQGGECANHVGAAPCCAGCALAARSLSSRLSRTGRAGVKRPFRAGSKATGEASSEIVGDSLAAWLEVGGDWADFWPLTPFQTLLIIRARRDGGIRAAHEFATFFGVAQAGKLKPVETYLSRKADKASMSDDEMLRRADRIFNAFEASKRPR